MHLYLVVSARGLVCVDIHKKKIVFIQILNFLFGHQNPFSRVKNIPQSILVKHISIFSLRLFLPRYG